MAGDMSIPANLNHGNNQMAELVGQNHDLNEIVKSIPTPTRDEIIRLQNAMIPIQDKMPEEENHFTPGVYLRYLTVPAGSLLVGKIHKCPHVFIVVSGKAIIFSEHGNTVVETGYMGVSQPGIKRVGLMIEETTFVDIHLNPTDTHDLGLLENYNIEPEQDDIHTIPCEVDKCLGEL